MKLKKNPPWTVNIIDINHERNAARITIPNRIKKKGLESIWKVKIDYLNNTATWMEIIE